MVVAAAQDEPLPVFVPPKPEPIPAYQRPVFRAPKLPGPDPPTRTAPAEPQHGHDWTGLRPFTVRDGVKAFHSEWGDKRLCSVRGRGKGLIVD